MLVRDAMSTVVLTIGPAHTLRQAAALMSARRVGAALVLDPDAGGIGILTERDILRAVAGRTHSSEARVRQWMTPDPVTATPETSAEDALKTMLDGGFRHLPVVEDDRPIGVVSIRHVARATGTDS